MKRVTSRQRLDYGDGFHASVPDDGRNSGGLSELDSDDENENDSIADYVTCRGNMSRVSSWISTSTSFDDTQAALFYDDDDGDESNGNEDSNEQPPIVFCCNPTPSKIFESDQAPLALTMTTTSTRKRDRPGSSSMKKSVSFSNLNDTVSEVATTSSTPTLIPAYDSELPPKKPVSMEDLIDDVHLHILSFLNPSDARSIGATCRQFRKLSHSEDARYLWADWCCRRWSTLLMSTTSTKTSPSTLSFVDSIATCTSPCHSNNVATTTTANLPILLGMASASSPSVIDQDQFVSPDIPPRIARWNRRLHNWQAMPPRANIPFQYVNVPHRTTTATKTRIRNVVQFTGTVGTGDRCIRSDRPLPRPKVIMDAYQQKTMSHHPRKWFPRSHSPSSSHHQIQGTENYNMILSDQQEHQQLHHNSDAFSSSNTRPSILDFICRGARTVSNGSSLRPFVVPYVEKDNRINLTPRMVAYFEVSILEKQQQQQQRSAEGGENLAAAGRVPPPPMEQQQIPGRTDVADCVAIGISSGFFGLHSKMPGWDSLSYGYHGDDGGIFHASGDMIKQYGPSFGSGDTIGCGIDYVNGGIFYTRNGEFLGYAWKDISIDFLMSPLYPTVGVDTNCPIDCNFGEIPFEFDLTAFNKKHEEKIRSSLLPLTRLAMMASTESQEGQGDREENTLAISPSNATTRRTKRDSNIKNTYGSTATSTEQHPIRAARLRMFHSRVSAV